jgi:archaellum component FlaG (FlaF/FlaG flagellin family)
MAVQEFVLLDDSNVQYPQYVTLQVKNSNIAMLQSLQIGQQITVHFNLRGREFVKDGQNKYFNTLEAWKIV